jgi:hypothetical protein
MDSSCRVHSDRYSKVLLHDGQVQKYRYEGVFGFDEASLTLDGWVKLTGSSYKYGEDDWMTGDSQFLRPRRDPRESTDLMLVWLP